MAETKNKGDTTYRQPVTENEPTSDIIFILDKMELLLQAVTKIEKDGRYRAIAAENGRRNSFLRINRNSNMFENFLSNFWSQLKDPARWGILSVRDKDLDTPANKRALEDLAAGKRSEAVNEFLEKYEI